MAESVGYSTTGIDRYGPSGRVVTVDHDEHHVTLSVESEDAVITPGQARMVAAWLIAHAKMAEAHSEAPNG